MQDPLAGSPQLSNAGAEPHRNPKLRPRQGVNRRAHEDLHDDPRLMRWTSGSATLTDGELSFRMPFRRMRHLGNFWWGVESADSANDLTLNFLVNAIVQSTATLLAGQTESEEVLLDWHTNEGDVVTLEFSGTPTDVTGPLWAEIEVDEAFL